MFDIDDHPNVEQAKQRAAARSVLLAVSNPCFELWALLHFEDHHSHIDRSRLRSKLKEHLPRYDKELAFDTVHEGYDAAVRRACALDAAAVAVGGEGRNPTTGVHRLTESIRTR